MTPNESRSRLSAELERLASRLQRCAERIRDGDFKGERFDVDDEVEALAITLVEDGAPNLVTALMSGAALVDIPDFDEAITARATEYAQLREMIGDVGLFEALEPRHLN
jgi:hypothetical protein